MTAQRPDPPAPIPDEQLWSWVDRDAPELVDHLSRHPEDRVRVDELRRAIRAVAGPERDDRLPDRIGPYPIKGRLGSGGMGIVFEAVQVRTNRPVAIKVIRGAWLDDEKTRRLFFREAEVLGRLQHPGIAAIHDAGETKEGSPYFVMERIEGETLDVWGAGQTLESKLEVAIQIAEAVHHAHGKGVIHRDLKPSNVLVKPNGEAKVLDFGLARIVDPGANASLTAAMSGKVIGTVRYMSPEQARGLASKVTPSSDVYSIGVLLYELLTGRLPHDFEGADLFESARRVAEDKIQRASRWAPELSRDLDAVLLRSLAKDPGARYPSAAALAEDLRRVRDGNEVEAKNSPTDLGEVIGQWGLKLGTAVGKMSTEIGAATADLFHSEESRKLMTSGTETARRAAGSAKELTRTAVDRVKKVGGDRTVKVDLNPILDAAATAGSTAKRSFAFGRRATRGALGTVKFLFWPIFGAGKMAVRKLLRLLAVLALVALILAVAAEGGDVGDALGNFADFIADSVEAFVDLIEHLVNDVIGGIF